MFTFKTQTLCILFGLLVLLQFVLSTPLTVVSDKSGEQQVKEALKKAEREAEKAAKEDKQKDKSKGGGNKKATFLKPEMSEGTNENDEVSNKRMKAMAAKLNNLVLKFQRKVMANKLHNALRRRVALGKKNAQLRKASSATVKSSGLDLTGLADPLAASNNAMSTPYKEDTKLEDRLALEAEEEKKFKDGETYDEDGGYGDTMKSNYAGTTSLSPKEQASQEMQRYNALISSESSKELSQIQDEISKATQSSMGKVSVQGENPSVPVDQQQPSSFAGGNNPLGGLGDLGGLGGLKGLGESNFAGFGGGLAGLGSLDGASAASQPLASVPGMGGLNLGGGQSDGALQGLSQDQSLAGAIDINPGAQNAEQQLPGIVDANAGTQGAGPDASQQIEGAAPPSQGIFNKKSKISSHERKATKSKMHKRRLSKGQRN